MPEPEYLAHIRWRRLPQIAPRRKRQGFGGGPPFRPSPETHAEELKGQLETALSERNDARTASGIDPSRLLVLSIVFENVEQRDALEKLGLQIVQEREVTKTIDVPQYVTLVEFASAQKMQQFLSNYASHNVSNTEPKRESSGQASLTKVELCFEDLEAAKSFHGNTSLHSNLGITKIPKPQKRSTASSFHVLVQFSDKNKLAQFQQEFSRYNTAGGSVLTDIQRQSLFDAVQSIKLLGPEDRQGARLSTEGIPNTPEFYMDVDLWHPGTTALVNEASRQFSQVVSTAGGRITDPVSQVAGTLLLARVKGNAQTLQALLKYDRVARVDLPPILRGIEFKEWAATPAPDEPADVDEDGPLACVVDSGVVAGHPFLSGLVVDERDFDSGEATVVDRVGHGTHVAGIVAYGDTQDCLANNQWVPKVRLLSAKIMKLIPSTASEPPSAGFADEERVETQLREAIRFFHTEYDCRIFNLSMGNGSCPYSNGGQLPWAFVLDELAKELDIVIVVSAGNVPDPEIPRATTEAEFQQAVREQLFTPEHMIIDPASAVLALTVGAISRPTPPVFSQHNPGIRQILGSPGNAPAPFTRTSIVDSSGDGLRRIVKPELVWYGGNYVLGAAGTWNRNDQGLGEISLKHDFRGQGGRLLAAASGTSSSAPYVTHVAALVEENLRKQEPETTASANLIRAMVVHSARIGKELDEWLTEGFTESAGEERLLRTIGYGSPDPIRALFSENNRSVLYAEDELTEDHFHLYELELPENFIEGRETRMLRITLAYDPPVSGTRKEYLARTMWFDLYRGLTPAEIDKARSANFKNATKIEPRKQASMRPTFTTLQWSTIQSAVFIGKTQQSFEYRADEDEPVLWHILVGSTQRFDMGAAAEQKYALVVSVEHSNAEAKIHVPIRQKNTARLRQHWQ